MDTDALIDHLSDSAQAVRPLRCPGWRTAQWLLISSLSTAVVVFAMSLRTDLGIKLTEMRFLIEQFAALATAVLAAYAALTLTIPGRSHRVVLLVGIPLLVWLASLGESCWQVILKHGPAGLQFQAHWECLPAIAMVGAIPAIAMVIMIRRGAPIVPRMTIALGALAAAAFGSFGLLLFHTRDATLMVLLWQFGSVVMLASLGGLLGKRLFSWAHVR